MCRSIKDGGRRCGAAYNMRLDFNSIRSVLDDAQRFRDNPSADNIHRQPIRRLGVYQRKLQAEAYNVDHALDELTATLVGEQNLEGEVTVVDDQGREMKVTVKRPAPRYDGTGVEEQLSPEQLASVSSKKLSMAQLREKHPDIYGALHTVNGKDAQTWLPVHHSADNFEERHSRYRNDYVKDIDKMAPDEQLKHVIAMTDRARDTRALQKEVRDTLTDALPVGTRFNPWGTGGIKVVETRDSVTPARLRSWGKEPGNEARAAQAIEDITYLGPDAAKIKKKFPELHASRRRPGTPKLEVTEAGD